jgi:putative peptide zinc metalloprotease protein
MEIKDIPDSPLMIKEYEVKEFHDKKNQSYKYIIKNQNENVYLILSSYEYFVLQLLNGENSVEDINLQFYQRFNRISVEYINNLLSQLSIKGFFENYKYDPSQLKFKQSILQFRFPIQKIEWIFNSIYQCLGKYIFHRWAIYFYILLSIVGILLFYSAPVFKFNFVNLPNIILLYCIVIISLFLHELAHALTLIHFKRRVNEAGFMFYMFLPVLYVNTSDIWMAEKKERILVSVAGPFCDLIVGSLFAIIFFFVREYSFNFLFYPVSALAYIRVLLNLNPLLKWDGYYCLMDLMNCYNLKEESMKLLIKGLPKKLQEHKKVIFDDVKLLTYALLSLMYTGFFLYLMFTTSGIKALKLILSMNFKNLHFASISSFLIILPVVFMLVRKICQLVAKLIAFITKQVKITRKNKDY